MSKIRFLVVVLISALLISGVSMLIFTKLASADVKIQPWDIVYDAPPIITVNLSLNNTKLLR